MDIWDANVTKTFHEAYEFGFDIDTPTDIVQAHMHDQLGVIPKETFSQLLPESWKAWSQLSDDIRVDILWALQVNGSQRSQESTRMASLCDKPRYYQTRVPQNATLNKTVQFNTTDDDATTPSSITTSVMTPLQLVLLHQPIQTWMNECATFFLTSLVKHTQMGSQTSSSPVSRKRQQASTVSGRNQKLRIFLQRIYVKCYPNVKDRTSHQ